jgi:dTDP-3-amino-3,4,6-trideoxy-alpha-D-glucose transaminase
MLEGNVVCVGLRRSELNAGRAARAIVRPITAGDAAVDMSTAVASQASRPNAPMPPRIDGEVPFVALDREHARIATELRAAFARVLEGGEYILGAAVERFESAWADACGTSHCVGVGSGTAALTLLLRAVGLRPGDEVIVPAHTFIATALAVVHAGGVPVLCDVDDATGLLDLDAAVATVGPRTAAVIPVHLYGQLCDMDAVGRFAERHGLAVIEDAAQAHGAECDGRRAGSFGAGAAFSFYPSKNLGALGDGGAVCTNDSALADRIRQLRNLGQRRKGEHLLLGANERLDAIQAALLEVKLRHLDEANAARRAHAMRYRARLGGRLRILHDSPRTPCVHHLYPVRVPNRDQIAAHMRRTGVQVGIHYTPALHRQPALRSVAVVPHDLPRAEAWAAEELSLPISPGLRPGEIDRAAAACLAAVEDGPDG